MRLPNGNKYFPIPRSDAHVELVGFLASIRSPYGASLKRISINQFTADRIRESVPEAHLWPANQHGVVLSFLQYKFRLDNELSNFEFEVEYRYQQADSDATLFPGNIIDRGQPQHLFNERFHV